MLQESVNYTLMRLDRYFKRWQGGHEQPENATDLIDSELKAFLEVLSGELHDDETAANANHFCEMLVNQLSEAQIQQLFDLTRQGSVAILDAAELNDLRLLAMLVQTVRFGGMAMGGTFKASTLTVSEFKHEMVPPSIKARTVAVEALGEMLAPMFKEAGLDKVNSWLELFNEAMQGQNAPDLTRLLEFKALSDKARWKMQTYLQTLVYPMKPVGWFDRAADWLFARNRQPFSYQRTKCRHRALRDLERSILKALGVSPDFAISSPAPFPSVCQAVIRRIQAALSLAP